MREVFPETQWMLQRIYRRIYRQSCHHQVLQRAHCILLRSHAGQSPQCLPRKRIGDEWGVLKVSAVSWGAFDPEENKALPPGMQPRLENEVKAGDFLLSRANTEELVARSVVVTHTPPNLMISDKTVRLIISSQVDKQFINVAHLSNHARTYYASNASGTSSSMKNVSREIMYQVPIPLPPLVEQHRIIAKIDQLMALCDELEQQIDSATDKRTELLNALMAQL
jgi:type I restriction enzyme, S subunit